jgi:hypothetical protein
MAITINGTTGIAGVDGSAGTPAVQGADTNTGMFFPTADTIAFAEGGAEAMRITSAGILDIGGTSGGSVGELLVVEGANSAGHRAARINNTSTTNGYSTLWMGSGNDGLIRAGSTAGTFTDQLLLLTSGATPVSFYTSNTERMRIDSSGNLLVGTTSQLSSGKFCISFNGGSFQGQVLRTTLGTTGSTYIQFENSAGATAGYIIQNGTTTVNYVTSSDYRLKEAIVPMTGALAKVAQLKPVTYKWKVDGSDGEGFIAHELAEVCPIAVTREKDAVDADGNPQYQGIDTSFLVATLTAAIQEQQALITQLQADVAALKGTP